MIAQLTHSCAQNACREVALRPSDEELQLVRACADGVRRVPPPTAARTQVDLSAQPPTAGTIGDVDGIMHRQASVDTVADTAMAVAAAAVALVPGLGSVLDELAELRQIISRSSAARRNVTIFARSLDAVTRDLQLVYAALTRSPRSEAAEAARTRIALLAQSVCEAKSMVKAYVDSSALVRAWRRSSFAEDFQEAQARIVEHTASLALAFALHVDAVNSRSLPALPGYADEHALNERIHTLHVHASLQVQVGRARVTSLPE
jgi:hypothetical protein